MHPQNSGASPADPRLQGGRIASRYPRHPVGYSSFSPLFLDTRQFLGGHGLDTKILTLRNDTVYEAVSYTHLDVYKRQPLSLLYQRLFQYFREHFAPAFRTV